MHPFRRRARARTQLVLRFKRARYLQKGCFFIILIWLSSGGMAEWLKAAVLKTVVPRGTVGSNPTSSAIKGEKIIKSSRL